MKVRELLRPGFDSNNGKWRVVKSGMYLWPQVISVGCSLPSEKWTKICMAQMENP